MFQGGLFGSDINDTMVFDFYVDLTRTKGGAYFFWWVTLVGGIYLSWKYRFKTVKILEKLHDAA